MNFAILMLFFNFFGPRELHDSHFFLKEKEHLCPNQQFDQNFTSPVTGGPP